MWSGAPLLLLLLLGLAGWAAATEVICYWGAWTSYRLGDGKVTVDDLDPNKCSIYIYSFAKLHPSTYTMVEFDPWIDIDQKGYEKFVAMKRRNAGLKVLIALGGWTDSLDGKYSTLLASAALRANFVAEAAAFVRRHGFDGLDLDYEYPSAADRAGFAAWAAELSAAFRPLGLLVTAAVSPSAYRISAGYDVTALAASLDMIHVMTYDLHGSWEASVADHHAPLYARATDNGSGMDVQSAMAAWMDAGAPAAKLAMGMPIYGRTWRVSGANKTPPAAASGAGTAGQFSGEAGSLTYLEICLNVNAGWTVVQDPTGVMGPYAYSGDQWVGYDDAAIVAVKTQYAVSRGFGGVMVWDVGSSDIRNVCGGGAWPIMSAIQAALGITETTAPTSGTTATTAGTTAPPTSAATTAPTGASTAGTVATTAQPGQFVCPRPNGLFADPNDCKKYYNCGHSVPHHKTCADGTLFDPAHGYCNWENQVICSSPMTTATASTTTDASSTTRPPSGAFVCPRPNGLFADPNDCKKYYNCGHSVPHHETCADDTFFDPAHGYCNWEDQVIHVTHAPGYLADPTDWDKHCNCSTGIAFHHACESGTSWVRSLTSRDWSCNTGCD